MRVGLWPVAGFALIVLHLPAMADEERTLLPELSLDAAQTFTHITGAALSADGQWFTYALEPILDGSRPVTVVAREVNGSTERRYSVGPRNDGVGQVALSPSGRSMAFLRRSEHPGSGLRGTDLAFVELRTGSQQRYADVASFRFLDGGSESLLLKGPSDERGVSDVRIVSLASGALRTFKDVRELSPSPSEGHVALVEEHGVRIVGVHSQDSVEVDSGADRYAALQWSEGGNRLAFVREANSKRAYVAVTRFNGELSRTLIDPSTWPDMPQGLQPASTVRWRDDGSGLFFSLEPIPDSSAATQPARLVLWHGKDSRLPGHVRLEKEAPREVWCYVALSSRRFTRLSDTVAPNVEPHSASDIILGWDASAYGWKNEQRNGTAAAQIRDYVLIDFKSGKRTSFLKGLRVATRPGLSIPPQLSPNGRFVVYRDNDGDYVAYDIHRRRHRNLTASLSNRFFLPENDPGTGWEPRDVTLESNVRLQGWSTDGSRVLISDFFDVWSLSLNGDAPINLTGNGREKNISYSLAKIESPPGRQFQSTSHRVDVSAPLYFYGTELSTGRTGLVRTRHVGSEALQTLHWEDAQLTFLKARKADVTIVSRSTAVEVGDYYRVGPQWQPTTRIAQANPAQAAFLTAPPARLLSFVTSKGDTRNVVVRLPTGYRAGQSYPAIVEIYKGLSQTLHVYQAPFSPSFPSERFLHQGYVILHPDIVPRVNEAGPAALEAVTGAVAAAVEAGYVDPIRLGLTGHSFGAFETNYIVTQTNQFRAAMSSAGMTNLWSDCGSVSNDIFSKAMMCQADQPYLGGPWWTDWNAYLANSPLFHARDLKTPLLIVHGDADRSVPFAQSVELFSTLREAGRQAVVLLQYVGQDHSLIGAASEDFDRRTDEFFAHFLKGAPAPDWWSAGQSEYAVPLESRSESN